jgi:hypothetical protein
MTRTMLEFTGQSGFGYSFDSLTEDSEEHPFVTSLKGFMCVPSDPSKFADVLNREQQTGVLSLIPHS